MKKIAALAEVHEIAVAPHNAADPLGIVASVHAMAGTPNFLIMEYGGGGGEGFFTNPLQMQDGFVELPQGAGTRRGDRSRRSGSGYSSRPLATADDAPPPRGRRIRGFLAVKRKTPIAR